MFGWKQVAIEKTWVNVCKRVKNKCLNLNKKNGNLPWPRTQLTWVSLLWKPLCTMINVRVNCKAQFSCLGYFLCPFLTTSLSIPLMGFSVTGLVFSHCSSLPLLVPSLVGAFVLLCSYPSPTVGVQWCLLMDLRIEHLMLCKCLPSGLCTPASSHMEGAVEDAASMVSHFLPCGTKGALHLSSALVFGWLCWDVTFFPFALYSEVFLRAHSILYFYKCVWRDMPPSRSVLN